ncbi:MAG TPA: hypothetical protein VI643_06365 [Planctomycetota bacterium]|nr:hypothetical protein [Planctomycetota bacterium]
MPIILPGGPSVAHGPFDRSFFQAALNEHIQAAKLGAPGRLFLFLTDGTTLDVCHLIDTADDYLVAACHRAEGVLASSCREHGASADNAHCCESKGCEMTAELIPYGLIYRVQISALGDPAIGFHPKPGR